MCRTIELNDELKRRRESERVNSKEETYDGAVSASKSNSPEYTFNA